MPRSREHKKSKKKKKKSDERNGHREKRSRDTVKRSRDSSNSRSRSRSRSRSNSVTSRNSHTHSSSSDDMHSRERSRKHKSKKRHDRDSGRGSKRRTSSPSRRTRSPSSSPPLARSPSPLQRRWSPSPSPTAPMRRKSESPQRPRSSSRSLSRGPDRKQPSSREVLEPAGRKPKDRRGDTDPPSRDSSKKRKRRRSRDETRQREEDAAAASAASAAAAAAAAAADVAAAAAADAAAAAAADAAAAAAVAAAAVAAAADTSARTGSKSKKSRHRAAAAAAAAAAAVRRRSRSKSSSFERPDPASPSPSPSPGDEAETAKRNGSTDRDARRAPVRLSPLNRPRSGSGQHWAEGPTPPRAKPPVPAKKGSSGKKTKLKGGKGSSLLSFGDDIGEAGDESSKAEFQSLGAATMNEFKRTHKKSQSQSTDVAAATAADDTAEDPPSVTARLGTLLDKKRHAVLGPSTISTADCRGQREYQEDRHVVVSCLHAPDDAHSKFDACPPCFFAVYDGHNGDLASEIAKSKLHTYVAKAAPETGLRGEPPERLEGLLRAAFASTETEILKEAEEDGGRQDGTTVTACLLVGDLLVTANVGDSCAVLGTVGHENKLRCKTISSDHKPEDPLEKRRILAAGGTVVFNGCYRIQHEDVGCRLAVSRSLGDSQFKGQGGQPRGSEAPAGMKGQLVSPLPAVKSVHLDPQDRVVIVASDGLWDVMTGLEAVEIALAAHGRTRTATGKASSWADSIANGVAGENAEADPANALVKEAVKRGTADNVTAIVVVLAWI